MWFNKILIIYILLQLVRSAVEEAALKTESGALSGELETQRKLLADGNGELAGLRDLLAALTSDK